MEKGTHTPFITGWSNSYSSFTSPEEERKFYTLPETVFDHPVTVETRFYIETAEMIFNRPVITALVTDNFNLVEEVLEKTGMNHHMTDTILTRADARGITFTEAVISLGMTWEPFNPNI